MPASQNRTAKTGQASLAPSTGLHADTGLVSLLILARFHDLPADAPQLRQLFGSSSAHFSDIDLLRAAKHVGLKAGVVKSRWDSLSGTPFPAIAKQRDGRYVVLAKVHSEKILIQDPLEGRPLVLSREQFESNWTGEVLLFAKRANLRQQDLRFDFTWFIPAIVKYRKFLAEVLPPHSFCNYLPC
ncbi:MAG: hlyB [Nitrospira sp.]|nr:hlyB [Nitrospira sp.]